MEGKDEPLEFKRVLDNIKVRYSTLLGATDLWGGGLCPVLALFVLPHLTRPSKSPLPE